MGWRGFTSYTKNGKGYPKRGDAIAVALGWLGAGLWVWPWSPGWARPWRRDPVPVRGED